MARMIKEQQTDQRGTMFDELLNRSQRVSKDGFATNFGGIPDDVVKMLNSTPVNQAMQEARDIMEADPANPCLPPLRKMEFGLFSDARELERGEVAAIDGTFTLPMQKYSAGQAICVGIGSLSHNRPMQESLHYWSSKVMLADAVGMSDLIERENRGLFGRYSVSYLRYYEVKHGFEIDEPYLLLDGPLTDKSLITHPEGIKLYNELFEHKNKRAFGVIKNVDDPLSTKFARALKPGEIYVIETLEDYLNKTSAQQNRDVTNGFDKRVASNIFRGVFKPRNKAFGFEVHASHFEDMVRIMAADCQINNPGHEIPYLLNRIDEEVRKHFNPWILSNRIASQMAMESEELFFGDTNERRFRS